MKGFRQRCVLSAVACVLLVGLGLVGWALATDSSQAQAGSIHNCPPAGKWSIAVWDGAGGTPAGDALAICGAGAVDAAYGLDAQTGGWSRWFAGKPEVSNLPPLSDMQGVMALGSAGLQPTPVPGLPNPASVYCVELGYELRIVDTPDGQAGICVFPDDTQCDEWSFFEGECGQGWAPEQDGTMHNCPPAGKWSIAVWDGAGGTSAAEALATCGVGAVDAAYRLDAQTGAWSRWFAGKPDVSNLPPLSDMQGVLALGSAPTPSPTPTPTPAPTPAGETGYLPPPQEVGHISASGNAVVTTSNDTPYTLTVEFQGPTVQTITIARCETCHEYSFSGPFSCPSGRPEETVTLAPGAYTVTARVDDPSVPFFVGDWTLEADTEYFQCFYIVTTFG